MARNLARPKSILRLTLVGFSLVAVPLILALVNAAVSVDRLANQGQQAVFQAVKETRDSRALVEDLIAMERNARQYQVLGDHSLLQAYLDKHQDFQETAGRLAALPLESTQSKLLDKLTRNEGLIFKVLKDGDRKGATVKGALNQFSTLSATARNILSENSRLIDREVQRMQDRAQWTQRTLAWQAVAMVPAAILLTIFFTVLIMRPIRQMDRAIRRLGDGHFERPVSVSGPADLEQLGERLDWLRQQLLQLEEQKGKFLRHISHELKTPLTTLREGSELLREQVIGELNAEQQEVAALLGDNALRLQRLIEDLLDFSMATGRAFALQARELRLDDLIRDVLQGQRVAMLGRRIGLRTRLDPVIITADAGKLRTVVDNLLSNALKYSPEGGELEIAVTSTQKGWVDLEVADQGPGIPPEERARVFDAFYQGASQSVGHVKGSGLGLSIAREFVQAHGGSIEVLDHGGGGTRVRVRLPAVARTERAA
ncbi:MAG TPA: ATP-binding protein [Gammaproteobacteria bacterium]|nr:ATP-binding protein [Gammaproteobacteria bacterium]